MLRSLISVALVNILFMSAAYTSEADLIRTYVADVFPNNFVVSDMQIAQLSKTFKHKNYTNDMNMLVANKQIHIEISRSLTRIYCAQLLKDGSNNAYKQFVAAQLSANVPAPLEFASFKKLSKHIQKLSALEYQLLETAAILSADGIVAEANNAKKLLYILFPPQTNFRHMLYTEGGAGMFAYLRAMIKLKYIDSQGLDLWYAYWITNIAGFRGHLQQDGSLYLTEPVAAAMLQLKDHIYELLDVPNYDPLVPYLEYRAQLLGVEHLPVRDRYTIAHLGCLLRLYTVTEGQRLYTSYKNVPEPQRQVFKNYFITGLSTPSKPTPTYAPALFCNALHMTSNNIEQVVTKILPVYAKILQQYQQQNLKVPLSLNELSAEKNVRRLLAANSMRQQDFQILDNGTVKLKT